MKVTLKKDTYNYFKNLIEGSGRKLIEEWKSFTEYGKNSDYWSALYDKTYKEAEFSSAQMVAKLLRGEIEIEKEEATRFVFYKNVCGSVSERRYYGTAEEVDKGIRATWYDTGFSHDERQMEALETLGWKKISLEQAQKEDK
ncbi:hypothetical protein [Lactococcus phage PLG-II]|nr:hypothetical protein [Lactococcus phage PLG-II]